MGLKERLVKMQIDAGYTDAEWAAKLDITRELWSYTKNGKRPIRFQVLKGAVRAFRKDEELRAAVLEYLGASEMPDDVEAAVA